MNKETKKFYEYNIDFMIERIEDYEIRRYWIQNQYKKHR